MMPWFLVLHQKIKQRACVKPASEDQLLSGILSNLRVVSLEGIRASLTFKAFSDKNAAMGRFGLKRLFAAVRIAPHAVARSPPLG
jgi:hypothetical protein